MDQTPTNSSPSSELSRELNLFHITMMGMGMMIGAGVFLGMGISIEHAGPGGVVLTFALNGLLAIFTAMSFAELSSAIPRAGGAYNFARIGFGRGPSFIAGWMEWFASSVAGAMYAVTFSLYTIRFASIMGWLNPLFDRFQDIQPSTIEGIVVKMTAVITASLFIYINYRGASETGKIGAVITVGQTIFVLTIASFGIVAAIREPERLSNFNDFMPLGWGKLLLTMGFTYVAFEGYEVIAQAGDEAIDPKRNLPKAMLYSVAIVTVIYVLVAFATVVSVKAGGEGIDKEPWRWIGQFGETGFGNAVAKLMPYGNVILTLAVIFSSTSALNATIYSATRSSYALGRDKMMPPFFAKISKKRNTPVGALLGTAVIVLVSATILPTKDVASSASMMFIMLFFLVNLCVIKIRRSMGDELSYGFIMPLFPLFPILAILCQSFLIVELREMSKVAWIIAPLWIVAGVLTYILYAKSRADFAEHEILVIDEKQYNTKESNKYSIMVAVTNPDSAAKLAQSTYRLCDAKDAKVEVLHMVPVPDQIALSDAEVLYTGREAILEAILYLAIHFPISTTIRYCRNVARGIVSAVREKKIKLLVLGWHGKKTEHLFNIGSTIDPIIEQSPCNVVVFKNCSSSKQYENILVPVAGGPNGAFALEIASHMADKGAIITVFTVQRTNSKFDLNNFVDSTCKKYALSRNQFKIKIVQGTNTLRTILNEAQEHDLLVLGTSEKPLLSRVSSLTLPDKIALRHDGPMIMVKSDHGVRSWIKRWI